MRQAIVALAVLLVAASTSQAQGLLIPNDTKFPPLSVVDQKATVTIDDQAATTRIEQTFRNHTGTMLEATYLFPVPKGAGVTKFSMWVNGTEQKGELVEADKARKIYTDIVRRTRDPGLLEYMDNTLVKLRVYPILANVDQKIALTYTSVAPSDNGLIEYVYPMRAGGQSVGSIDKFTISVHLKSQYPITNIYSPSHPISYQRPNDKEAIVGFEKNATLLDRDFHLYYQAGTKDVGMTWVGHRPNPTQDGYFMLLMSPRTELSKAQQVARDFIMVLDTSGSMNGKRIQQARKALKFCVNSLGEKDRFALINFATTVNKYTENLQAATPENLEAACRWVDGLEATGSTAIDDALKAALAMRPGDQGRPFTVIFFTDGQPTIGECDPNKIIANVRKNNTGNTRIFSFGVGDDVNAVLLDALADNTRAVSTYVRETEDIEAKVSGLYSKISNPVLTELRLSVGDGVTLNEVYPPNLPDLFHGTQLVVFGRYKGKGKVPVKLLGTVGKVTKEFVYDVDFAPQTGLDKGFVEDLWARRKVGFLLDQIRLNGQSKETMDEVVMLAKRYGIATPYTSYLLVPDGQMMPRGGGFSGAPRPIGRGIGGAGGFGGGKGGGGKGGAAKAGDALPGLPGTAADRKITVADIVKDLKQDPAQARAASAANPVLILGSTSSTMHQRSTLDQANATLASKQLQQLQQGKLGVDFAVQNNALREQQQLTAKASRVVQNRNCIDVGGIWIDDGFNPKMTIVSVKAMSDAYFRMLERHAEIRDVFSLGNYLVWVTPSGKALVVDGGAGAETMTDAEIDGLFVAAAKK